MHLDNASLAVGAVFNAETDNHRKKPMIDAKIISYSAAIIYSCTTYRAVYLRITRLSMIYFKYSK